ncbi:ABC transporter permease [Oceanicella actignis]|uniref:Microcin C transport system permease protein n=1 Tax=Oceanicella actignis TaxID=1189325 RepID=A0A1M7SCZ0_9RHOB|nr:ABC transporter permease [Oceanicella actignis]SET25718.1 microcin C transport system permease protein [Oceanicella actignis]SHN56348.1 microcin C transport system permease protein [Oceanicella actignis]
MKLDALQRRRWRNFRANRRGFWSLWIFLALFVISLFAEFVANDKPILVVYRGQAMFPIFEFHAETEFGGDFETEADYRSVEVQCLILTGGLRQCFDDPEGLIARARAGDLPEGGRAGRIVWPLIPFSYDTINYQVAQAPSPPDSVNWLGTDDQARDVLARVIYGFRISVLFGFALTALSSVIGIFAGAAQGYFGGWVDLTFQRVEEIWSAIPVLFLIMIIAAIVEPTFWSMLFLLSLFQWTALVGVVRAEFLRARNFEYVRAARALGVGDWTIMRRHLLPNAMVATLTMLPFILTSSISTLATLDFIGFGLPPSYPSLGDLALQGKNNLQAPWLGFTAFFTFAIMLSLLVFVFEAVRDAFDPRKIFR